MRRYVGTALLPFALSSALAMLLPALVHAAPWDGTPKILAHIRPVTTKNACNAANLANCMDAVTEGSILTPSNPGPFYFVHVLAARGSSPSVAAVQFGIQYQFGCPGNRNDYQGVDILAWNVCASLEFTSGNWPDPGSGNLVTWDSINRCQTGEVGVAGYFYMGCYWSPDILQIVPRPVDGLAKIADCNSFEVVVPPASLGRASFSAGATIPGCNPCDGPCTILGPSSCQPPMDGIPPAVINDLAVESTTSTTATLGWTVPADNPGGSGLAGYEVRRSTAPITPANFGAAALIPSPSPIAPGAHQTLVNSGLVPNSIYYFAMRTRDLVGNWSDISNVAQGTTDVPVVNTETKLLLHVGGTSPVPGSRCNVGALDDCEEAVAQGGLGPHYVYLLAAEFEDLAGLLCGISYDGGQASGLNDHDRIDILDWSLCADLQFASPSPAWPAPGSGIIITWDSINHCQAGPVAVAGFFYMTAYGADELRITRRGADNRAAVANCGSAESDLQDNALGTAVFSVDGKIPGYNPCLPVDPVNVTPTTWSRVKTLGR